MRRALLLLAAVLAGCGGEGEPEATRTVLLVSGRDDHGLLVHRNVEVRRSIGGERAGEIRDGTLVAVTATSGEWIEVKALEGRPVSGWVNDYYLRGTAHLTRPAAGWPRNAQVELLAVDGSRVRVRSTQTRRVAWVERSAVAELPVR